MNATAKTVLMIASLYGSKRVVGLAKYLTEFGWHSVIVTPSLSWQPTISSRELPEIDGVRIIETQYSGIKEPIIKAGLALGKIRGRALSKLLHIGGAILSYPDSRRAWRKFALQTGREVLDRGGVDALVSICPVTSHIVASQLKKEYGLKWICDQPDPWSQNCSYAYGNLRRMLDTRLELRTLASADALIASSEPRAEKLRELHKGKRVVTITLGYDEKEYDAGDVELTKKFTITYTGSVYPGGQNPMLLIEAVSRLIDEGKIDPDDCEIRMYGDSVKPHRVIRQYGRVIHADVVKAQKESQLLWLLDCDYPNEMGDMPGKVFEYLGAMRPILATGGVKGNVVDKLIQETCSGYHAMGAGEVERVLLKCYQEWKQTGRVGYHGVGGERYTQKEMARKYAGLLC